MLFSLKTYRNGTHPNPNKSRAINQQIVEAPIVDEYVFPLSMHLGAPANAVVAVGDYVKKGQKIGEAAGFISANTHSSVSGEVIAIEKRPTLNGMADCIVIKNDYKEETVELEDFDTKSLVDQALIAGIVGMGGATFPTNVKLAPPLHNRLDTLIINGSECEPYVTADSRLMIEESDMILKGIDLVLNQVKSIKQVFIALESINKEAISVLKQAISNPIVKVRTMKTQYPQGAEKTLIKTMTGREVPSAKLPAEVGCLVMNVATIYSLAKSVETKLPNVERIVTVNGKSVKNPTNFRTKYGTPAKVLLEAAGVDFENTEKIMSGGVMMGRTISSLDTPIIKGTNGLTCLTPAELKPQPATPCIMCSECLNGCPMNLQPILISESALKGQFDYSSQLGAMDCIECGNCTFGCPAKIDLLANIRHAKTNIRAAQEVAKK